jgi:hypothetical protein
MCLKNFGLLRSRRDERAYREGRRKTSSGDERIATSCRPRQRDPHLTKGRGFDSFPNRALPFSKRTLRSGRCQDTPIRGAAANHAVDARGW